MTVWSAGAWVVALGGYVPDSGAEHLWGGSAPVIGVSRRRGGAAVQLLQEEV